MSQTSGTTSGATVSPQLTGHAGTAFLSEKHARVTPERQPRGRTVKHVEKNYNLDELYGKENKLQRYKRLTCGENVSFASVVLHELVLGLFGNLPGMPGWGIRKFLYPLCFKGIDRGAFIGRYVTLRCPRQIRLSPGVIIDDFVQLIATSRHPRAIAIGEGTFLRSYAMINAGPPEGFVHIGQNSSVGQGALIYGNGGLSIGSHVMIAGQCAIIASSHRYDRHDLPMVHQGYSARGITIQDNVWIGAGARILDGVTIGENAIVGANAVVNRSVKSGDRVGGIPAKSLLGN